MREKEYDARMEIETIKKNTIETIIELLNKAIQVEYGMILNYPRLIDRIVNIDKIHDEQLNTDLERVGKDSTRHLGSIGQLVVQLGGEPFWQLEVIDRLVDAEKMLEQQLVKEKAALSLYEQAKRAAEQNKVKIKVKDFLGRLIRTEDELPINAVNANDVIATLDRLINDEQYHIRLIQDSLATLKMLLNK